MENLDFSSLLSVINADEGMKNFKKSHYPEFFEKYLNEVSHLHGSLNEIGEIRDEALRRKKFEEAFMQIVSYVKDSRKSAGFFKRDRVFMDCQTMLVFYVLPGIVENVRSLGDRVDPPEDRGSKFRMASPKKEEEAKGSGNECADLFVSVWNREFGQAISAASYDLIFSGFKEGLLGMLFKF